MKDIVTVVFSYNRPLQLDLLLKSLRLHCKNYDELDVNVLYKVDNTEIANKYRQCSLENEGVHFIKENNFQYDLGNIFPNYEHIMFLTDDSIFTRSFNTNDATNLFESNEETLGFSLRLGQNLDYCYSLSKEQSVPTHAVDGKIMLWNWTSAESDWNYPLEVSSSIYKMSTIYRIQDSCAFQNPNFLEWFMDQFKKNFAEKHPMMACYKESVAFSAPINKVSKGNENNQGEKEENSIETLLTKYDEGMRVNPDKFIGYETHSVHEEVDIYE